MAGVSLSLSSSLTDALFGQNTLSKLADVASATSPASTNGWPQYTEPAQDGGKWLYFDADTWTSGFFSASLYALHERTNTLCPASSINTTASSSGSQDWLTLARKWNTQDYQTMVEQLTNTHDVGFLSLPLQYELALDSTNATVKQAILGMADHLAARFSPVVGCTRSWDQGGPDDFEVIIDNMMNLQLLLLGTSLSGNATYTSMALSHSNKTIANHVRPEDGSTFHVVDYSASTGQVLWRGTAQGYSNSSTWSRGQAWAIYGFAQMYQLTNVSAYLDTARSTALYYIDHLPSDIVPYWDFDAPTPTTRDSSSTTIASSALLLLSELEAQRGNSTGSNYYQSNAIKLLEAVNSLAGPAAGWSGQSILGNGTVNNRANPPNNNTGIIYGDYYFVEAGNRLLKLGIVNCSDASRASSSASVGTNGIIGNGTDGTSAGDNLPAAGASTGTGNQQVASSGSVLQVPIGIPNAMREFNLSVAGCPLNKLVKDAKQADVDFVPLDPH